MRSGEALGANGCARLFPAPIEPKQTEAARRDLSGLSWLARVKASRAASGSPCMHLLACSSPPSLRPPTQPSFPAPPHPDARAHAHEPPRKTSRRAPHRSELPPLVGVGRVPQHLRIRIQHDRVPYNMTACHAPGPRGSEGCRGGSERCLCKTLQPEQWPCAVPWAFDGNGTTTGGAGAGTSCRSSARGYPDKCSY
jgi:hypothetical protein